MKCEHGCGTDVDFRIVDGVGATYEIVGLNRFDPEPPVHTDARCRNAFARARAAASSRSSSSGVDIVVLADWIERLLSPATNKTLDERVREVAMDMIRAKKALVDAANICPICKGDKRLTTTYHMPIECPHRCGFTYTGCTGNSSQL